MQTFKTISRLYVSNKYVIHVDSSYSNFFQPFSNGWFFPQPPALGVSCGQPLQRAGCAADSLARGGTLPVGWAVVLTVNGGLWWFYVCNIRYITYNPPPEPTFLKLGKPKQEQTLSWSQNAKPEKTMTNPMDNLNCKTIEKTRKKMTDPIEAPTAPRPVHGLCNFVFFVFFDGFCNLGQTTNKRASQINTTFSAVSFFTAHISFPSPSSTGNLFVALRDGRCKAQALPGEQLGRMTCDKATIVFALLPAIKSAKRKLQDWTPTEGRRMQKAGCFD